MTTIAQERAGLTAVGLRLRRREEAGFRHNYTTARAVTEPANRVFVHITITNPNSYSSDDAHARAVEAIGIARFGSGVSYNRLHMRSGRAYEGQPIGRRGTHTGSYSGSCAESGCPNRGGGVTSSNHNVTGRGYVICQNVDDSVTDAEFDALARSIAADQLAGFVLRGAPIHGHRCVSDKSCPGPLMWVLMGELERLVDQYVRDGLPGDDMATAEEIAAAVWRAEHIDPVTGAPAQMVRIVERIRKDANTAAISGPDVDEAALAASLAPLLIPHLPSVVADLDDATIAQIATAVADEQARRLAS